MPAGLIGRRGIGAQASLLFVNLAGFWGVGMTSAAVLTFVFDYGVAGLWLGTIAGVFTSAALNMILLLRVDWQVGRQ